MTTIKRAPQPINVASSDDRGSGVERAVAELVPGLTRPVDCPIGERSIRCECRCYTANGEANPDCDTCGGAGEFSCECQWEEQSVLDTIVHLNDAHHWTFVQLADWLDSLDIDLTVVAPYEPLDPANDYEDD